MASHVLEDSGGVVVVCNSTQGSFRIILSKPAEVPIGSTRFLELVDAGVFTNVALFRVVKGFLVQFGIAPTATALTYWRNRGAIQDDSKPSETVSTFLRGSVSFAGSGPNSRTTNLFIAYKDSISLGAKAPWELPFGHVPLPDMDRVVDAFNGEYGDIPPWGHGPDPHQMSPDTPHAEAYLSSKFPALNYLRGCSKHVAHTCLQDTTLSTDDLLRRYGSTHIQHIPCGRQQDFLSLHAIPGTGSAYDTVYARLSKVQNPAWGVFFLFSSLFLLWHLFRWCSSKSTGTLTGVAIVGNGGGLLGVERTITATGGATTVLQDLELGRVGIRRPIEGIDNPFQDRKCE